MTARLSAFIVWAALAASAVFWGLRLGGASPVAPAHTVPVSDVVVPRADLTRLFGAEPVTATADAPPTERSNRFQLIGVVAPRVVGAPGIALIAVDGKPPRPYRIGASIDNDLLLQGVQSRGATIGPRGGEPSVRLELPPLAAAATGSLPPPSFAGEAPPPAVVPPPQPQGVPGVPVVPPQGVPPGGVVPPTAIRPMPAMPPPQQQQQQGGVVPPQQQPQPQPPQNFQEGATR